MRTMHLSIRWPRSIILRGLPLCGWVAIVPNCFHFVIIPLTVDCGIFRRDEISWLDLLHRWHPITVACWNSPSSWERPILSQMFVETVACLGVCFYTPVAMEVIGTPDFNYLDGWVNTLGNIVYLLHHALHALSPMRRQHMKLINVGHSMYILLDCRLPDM